jgi:hypothetical protein
MAVARRGEGVGGNGAASSANSVQGATNWGARKTQSTYFKWRKIHFLSLIFKLLNQTKGKPINNIDFFF